ncbi:transposase [Microcoleus sp. Pol7_A1]|uniref:transposase n=1 Tax=Microcoleus sp. Pol7_A1 TaxID=2818893 RepID=UPI004040BE06
MKKSYSHALEEFPKSKYALLKNKKYFDKQQSQKLAEVKEVFPRLKTMHELKEKIRNFLGGK